MSARRQQRKTFAAEKGDHEEKKKRERQATVKAVARLLELIAEARRALRACHTRTSISHILHGILIYPMCQLEVPTMLRQPPGSMHDLEPLSQARCGVREPVARRHHSRSCWHACEWLVARVEWCTKAQKRTKTTRTATKQQQTNKTARGRFPPHNEPPTATSLQL